MSYKPKIVLASASIARKELMSSIGYTPDVICPANIDEAPLKAEKPNKLVERLAIAKAQCVMTNYKDDIVIACDTTVRAHHKILNKPEDEDEARYFLSLLSGRRHRVYTGICVIYKGIVRKRVVMSIVKLKRLTNQDIDWFISTNDWEGRAGGYTIRGAIAQFVIWISGTEANIMGLPLYETYSLIKSCGV